MVRARDVDVKSEIKQNGLGPLKVLALQTYTSTLIFIALFW
jgi:hypothetical protein